MILIYLFSTLSIFFLILILLIGALFLLSPQYWILISKNSIVVAVSVSLLITENRDGYLYKVYPKNRTLDAQAELWTPDPKTRPQALDSKTKPWTHNLKAGLWTLEPWEGPWWNLLPGWNLFPVLWIYIGAYRGNCKFILNYLMQEFFEVNLLSAEVLV